MENNITVKRIDCWNDTLNISNNLLYSPPPSSKYEFDYKFVINKICENSNIDFFNMDAIDCCLEHSPNALVLNLADNFNPGGIVQMGSGAQEESLFRRTNYCRSLKTEFYPLINDELIYSPGISVIKTSERTGWKSLYTNNNNNNLPKIAFVACPGIHNPRIIWVGGEKRLIESDVVMLKQKIRTIIQTAVKCKHETIILGALGCGAWKNPPKHVAEIFKDVLYEYNGAIVNFYFAILTTRNENENYSVCESQTTIDIFRDVFDKTGNESEKLALLECEYAKWVTKVTKISSKNNVVVPIPVLVQKNIVTYTKCIEELRKVFDKIQSDLITDIIINIKP